MSFCSRVFDKTSSVIILNIAIASLMCVLCFLVLYKSYIYESYIAVLFIIMRAHICVLVLIIYTSYA